MPRMSFLVITTLALSSVALHATCPTPKQTNPPGAWSDGTYVPFSFNVGNGGPPPDGYNPLQWSTLGNAQAYDIPNGIGDWNYVNTTQNTSSVVFYSSSSGALSFYAYVVNYPGSPGGTYAGAMSPGFLFINGQRTDIIVEASITFYFNSYNGYTLLSQSAPDYDTFMMKVTLHEIGHSMGLGENYFAPAQQSVMNSQNLTNDAGNSMATNVTACDNQSLPIH